MNRLFVAKKLMAFVDDASVMSGMTAEGMQIEAKQEIKSEVWDKMIQYMQNNTDCAKTARGTTGSDDAGNKALQKARAMYSVIQKVKELRGIDITNRFTFKPVKVEVTDPVTGEKKMEDRIDTFESVAIQQGASAADCCRYVEPPNTPLKGQPGFLDRLLQFIDTGSTTLLYQRNKTTGVSNVKMNNFESHSAYQTFKSRFLLPLQTSQVTVHVASNGASTNEMMYIMDKIRVDIPMFGVKFAIELSSATNAAVEDMFTITSWTGPKTNTDIPLDEFLPLSGTEIDTLVDDIKNANFKGSSFTPDVTTKDENGVEVTNKGRNIMLLSDNELSTYFFSSTCTLNDDEKIEIMNKRKDAKKKDTITADNMLAALSTSPSGWDNKVLGFMADFQNVFDWQIVSKVMANLMPEAVIEAFHDKVDWKFISSKRGLSDAFVKKFAKQLDEEKVLRNSPSLSQDAKDELAIAHATVPQTPPAEESAEEEVK